MIPGTRISFSRMAITTLGSAGVAAFALLHGLPEESRHSQVFRVTRADTGAPVMVL